MGVKGYVERDAGRRGTVGKEMEGGWWRRGGGGYCGKRWKEGTREVSLVYEILAEVYDDSRTDGCIKSSHLAP